MVAGLGKWFEAPVLSGRYVRLEPMSLDHVDGLLAMPQDKLVFEHLRYGPFHRREEAERYVREALADHESPLARRVPWIQLDVRDGGPGVVAGSTSYYEIHPEFRSITIGGTWLGTPWWRTGLNTESKLLLLQRAFDDLGAVRVVWHADIRNTRSQEAIARLGATREGVLRKHMPRRDGSWRDSVKFAMTDEDWPGVRDQLTARLEAS
ncbi:GNAT family N-acetyltransferase [Tenggerimyces flavus]|uniref:GNAT family N-acetyltransferase n=1 Tax=Tenggerimyces flavus TaxID=1708749 RepID=A0ABV7YPD3_9ACTN